jgi:hypothetical protein
LPVVRRCDRRDDEAVDERSADHADHSASVEHRAAASAKSMPAEMIREAEESDEHRDHQNEQSPVDEAVQRCLALKLRDRIRDAVALDRWMVSHHQDREYSANTNQESGRSVGNGSARRG